MQIPDRKQCLKLLEQHEVPAHIKAHCLMVARVSLAIVRSLDRICISGHDAVDIKTGEDFALAAGLLHDIAKLECIKAWCEHAKRGAEILKSYGLVEIADAVRQHVFLDRTASQYREPDAAMILNYADKRVMHTRFVSLETRFKDLFKRYGTTKEGIKQLDLMLKESKIMEDVIFRHSSTTAEGLKPAHWR